MNKFFVAIFALASISLTVSCSSVRKNSLLKKELVRPEEKFSYTDKNGTYRLKLSSGFNKKENSYFTKRILEIPEKDKNERVLEQSIVLSDLGSIKNNKMLLRPKVSQYSVWFEGKKYFSELRLNAVKKSIDLKMVSPEAQWNGVRQIKLPSTESLYCFFSQVMECAKVAGFLSKAIEKETGEMNFYIIWEGYPYLNETFSDFPSELMSRAQLEFDGKKSVEEYRFNLKVAGQSIFFIVDKNEQMKKMFWVSQGISVVSSTSKKNTSDDEESLE